MPEPVRKKIKKSLFIDLIMGIVFISMLTVAVWLVWVYYFRGPISIVTENGKPQIKQQILALPRDEYSAHFHNYDAVVLAGIKTGSSCLHCHGDYPHSKDQKVRSLLNAHAWFIACETCHLEMEDGVEVKYLWFDNKSGAELTKLTGKNGDYGAAIVPVTYEFWAAKRLDAPRDEDFIHEYLQSEERLSDDQKKEAMKRVHNMLTKTPVYCDQCHVENGMLDFTELLYSTQSAQYLESIDMGAMARTYKEFHFPNLFDD